MNANGLRAYVATLFHRQARPALVSIVIAGCAAAPGSRAVVSPAPSADGAGPLRHTASNTQATVAQVNSALLNKRFVLLGEKHDNPAHHRGQATLIEALVRAGKRPAIVFEMISETERGALARYSEQPNATAEQLGPAVRWEQRGWPAWRIYQPIARVALAARLELVAGGISRTALMSQLRAGTSRPATGSPASPHAYRLPPPPNLPAAAAAALAKSVEQAHCGYANARVVAMMVRAQQLRDAFMARQLFEAAKAGGNMAVMIAGNEHARRDRGIPFYLQHTHGVQPDEIGVVSFSERSTQADTELSAAFDFVWSTPRHDKRDPCERFREQLERMKQAH